MPLTGPFLSLFSFIQGVALLRELSAKLHVQFRLRVDNTNMNRKEIKKLLYKLKGVFKMNKKKWTSWGVSFSSIALVAGMIGYLGITNKDTSSKTNTVAQATTKSSTQSSQSGSTISYEIPSQTTSNSNSAASQTNTQSSSTSQSFEGQHGGFDTTTGGT
ncbi:MAG: hypothetical protein Q8912_14950 [Bacillota bacterium]|nr:hypothetical protein [Bacillota bacterium]